MTQRTLGERFRQLREGSGLTLTVVSRRAGMSMSHLVYIEGDQKIPGDAALEHLFRVYGLSRVEAEQLRQQRDEALRGRGEFDAIAYVRELNLGPSQRSAIEDLLS